MRVKEILEKISKIEGVFDYRQIPPYRWIEIKDSKKVTKHIDFDETEADFNTFANYLRTSVYTESRVNKPIIIKTLNNAWYV
ncbi:hypothetical protein [Clostridium sporogenes]|nr:hypothetical protein [Clostridium sporogenes]